MKFYERPDWLADLKQYCSINELKFILNLNYLTPLPPPIAKQIVQLLIEKQNYYAQKSSTRTSTKTVQTRFDYQNPPYNSKGLPQCLGSQLTGKLL